MTGLIPFTVDSEHTTLLLDTKNKNFTDFAEESHLSAVEWERIPYDRDHDRFIISVNGTHITATTE
ncbi:hypothetical protein Pmar_PMAR021059 [Perkinsus marinus ATCC 50983]|uniref:Uncharacterized protein n=1 Tax=Perkinsus marinus (strain ATCC 50983 / TXsc) TaxID=423536 RepID=C5KGA5_PERM5|nr:hypothetical protein Pmar_PMAR021059 [Perkinsus marinus ATCC 50983]EER16461.1 hypothetical protein Pmar_PMAR021059 [Perkinsus marinus ATCC 50983]|eukprot:XP_002784665.1 hypothetical protein Pmar_PMAR021059 [Perkinsus marinus ATCC 50983]